MVHSCFLTYVNIEPLTRFQWFLHQNWRIFPQLFDEDQKIFISRRFQIDFRLISGLNVKKMCIFLEKLNIDFGFELTKANSSELIQTSQISQNLQNFILYRLVEKNWPKYLVLLHLYYPKSNKVLKKWPFLELSLIVGI